MFFVSSWRTGEFQGKVLQAVSISFVTVNESSEHLGTFEKYCSVANYDPLDRLNLFVVRVALPPFSEMASLGRPRVESVVF